MFYDRDENMFSIAANHCVTGYYDVKAPCVWCILPKIMSISETAPWNSSFYVKQVITFIV